MSQRGRPRNPPKAKGVADPLTPAQRASIRAYLEAIPEVAALPDGEFEGLLADVAEAVAFAKAARDAPRAPPLASWVGNRPAIGRAHALNDASRAWEKATGVAPKVWSDGMARGEALAVKIARVIIGAADGGAPYRGDLRRQVYAANSVRPQL